MDLARDLLELAAHMEADAIVISSDTLITRTTSRASARSVLHRHVVLPSECKFLSFNS